MYYHFEKATGVFAGSGIEPIENDEYGSTETAPPAEPASATPILTFNGDEWVWTTPS